jgi:hypothetical protein
MTTKPPFTLLLAGLALCVVAISCRPGATGQAAAQDAPQGRSVQGPSVPAPGDPVFSDDFSADELDTDRWVHTVKNDLAEDIVDIQEGRLRLAASTLKTDDTTVKYHGVRTKTQVVDLSDGPLTITLDLDWNNQPNGCYLSADLYLCPEEVDSPTDAEQYLCCQYIGVPPGQNARFVLSRKRGGYDEPLYTEGWPEKREGRKIGLQHLRLIVDRTSIVVVENDAERCEHHDLGLEFEKAYLYIQQSSHSNYPLRTVFFDNITVQPPR